MKRLRKSREKRLLQTSLMFDFLFFNAMLLLVLVAVYVAFTLDVIRRDDGTSPDPDLKVEASYYRDGSEAELERLEQSGGWLELLNAEREIVRVVGVKNDSIAAYDESELYERLSNASDQPYYYSLSPSMEITEEQYLLLKIPRTMVNIDINNTEPVTTLHYPYSFYIFLGIGLILLLIFVYSYWVARRIKKPLRILTLGLKQMIEGNYNTRISLYAEKEFTQIGDTFNYMADVIERTTAEKRYAEESKQRLIVNLSHDLKTPITSIQGYAQALNEGRGEDSDRQKRYLSYIYNKASQVTKLIQNMLELLKVDSPDFFLRIERQEIVEFLRETMAETYGEIEQKKFALQFQVPEEDVYARFDAELLSSVLHNLISNALMYNPPGTSLRVELIPLENEVDIEIADTGTGIPQELWATIFDPFVRGDEARTTTGGTGLGLSIARKNTEKMGGTLRLDSRGEESTLFTIRLPR